MTSKRPVDLPVSQIIKVNAKSPVAMVSILHRLSGALLFVLVPVLLWLLQKSLGSPEGFAYVSQEVFGSIGVKFVVWLFVAGLLYHFVMGVKHMLADLGVAEELKSGRMAAVVSAVVAAVLIVWSFVWIML